MIQKIKNIMITSSTAIVMVFAALAMPLVAHATTGGIQGSLCSGANSAATGSTTDDPSCGSSGDGTNTTQGIRKLAADITNWITIVVGALAVIMIIVGGFRYITSGGDSGKVGGAKNTIIYAIIGLIIVALAQIIVHFVVKQSATSSGDFGT